MKTTKKHFEIFKKECQKWISRFELSSFEFRFHWEKIDSRAYIDTSQVDKGVIKVAFNIEWNITEKMGNLQDYIERVAKHEMIHCLMAEYIFAANSRFIIEDDLCKLEEKLTNKLEKIIN